MKWKEIQKEVKTMEGKRPQSDHAVRNAVARVDTVGARGIATTKYKKLWAQIWRRWWEVHAHTQPRR